MPLRERPEPTFMKVSVSCLAEILSSPNRSIASVLRAFKYPNLGEGAGRSAYYRRALNAIRKYHTGSNDKGIFDRAVAELQKDIDEAQNRNDRIKCEKNIVAINLYKRVYGDRHFRILPNRRIAYRIGRVLITAQPDLWVEENGIQVLVKIGVSKKQISYIDILLTLIRKAAVSSGYRSVRPRNVVYLNVTTGHELICTAGLVRFNRTFKAVAREIARAWPNVHPGKQIEETES
jgi:hypothetical protein